MKNLVIVAGGLGSRLAPLTNHIPKFLVNIGKETGLVKQLEYWREYYPETITLIVNEEYAELVKAYCDLYFPPGSVSHPALVDGEAVEVQTPIIIKTVNKANGSAHAIMSTCDHLIGKDVLFTWCDVIPDERIEFDRMFGSRVWVFTNYDHPNRYGLVKAGTGWADLKPELTTDGRGGIFGMYSVQEYERVLYEDGQDFVEVLTKYAPFVREYNVKQIIDFGDMPKLERTRAKADKARSFNSVEMHGDLVLKQSLNSQGDALIQKEIAWYAELDSLEVQSQSFISRPKIWPAGDRRSFVMTKMSGIPIWQAWPTLDEPAKELVLARVFEQMNAMHANKLTVSNEVVLRDIKAEALDKLIARYQEIKAVIDAFGKIDVVNGVHLLHSTPEQVITQLHDEIKLHYKNLDQHSLIHGDLQMSNALLDPDTLEVQLIDPRGYFGKSVTYGLADYDVAKFLYSMTGYDLFNYSNTFSISKQGNEIKFDIPTPAFAGDTSKYFKRVHHLWAAVCWIGLAQYIKNDPVKSVAAHYHGMSMGIQLLNT